MIRKFLVYWLPPLLLMTAIFAASSRQSIAVTHEFVSDFIIFKSLHIMEYAVLTFLLFRALYKTSSLTHKKQLIIAVVLAILYGMLDEIHQTFVPTRSGAIRDVFIDGIGIFGMYFFIKKYFGRLKRYMY